jgi:oxalate decarboxylase
MEPTQISDVGSVTIVDSTNFEMSQTIAISKVVIKPGGMRALHWHPNADEWQYFIEGKGRVSLFDTGPVANTMEFYAGDVGVIPRGLGHYIDNIGDTDLIFLEVFKTNRFEEVTLASWLKNLPAQMVEDTLEIPISFLSQTLKAQVDVFPP